MLGRTGGVVETVDQHLPLSCWKVLSRAPRVRSSHIPTAPFGGCPPPPRFIIRIKQTQVPLNLLRRLLWARVWSVCVPVLRAHRKNTYSALLGGSCKCHSDKALSPCVPTGSSPLVLCVIERGAVEPPGAIVDLPVALCNCITFYNMCFKLLLLRI